MNTIKQTILTGWNFRRGFRMGVGIFFLIWGIVKSDNLLILGGSFFILTTLSNVGCCGAGGCSVPRQKVPNQTTDDITYEEIKNP